MIDDEAEPGEPSRPSTPPPLAGTRLAPAGSHMSHPAGGPRLGHSSGGSHLSHPPSLTSAASRVNKLTLSAPVTTPTQRSHHHRKHSSKTLLKVGSFVVGLCINVWQCVCRKACF